MKESSSDGVTRGIVLPMFALLVAVLFQASSAQAQSPFHGRWQSVNSEGFVYTFDTSVQSGQQNSTTTLVGEVSRLPDFDEACARRDRPNPIDLYLCERLDKDGPFVMGATLRDAADGTLAGADDMSGLGISMEVMGESGTVARLVLSQSRADGSTANRQLLARKRDTRPAPQTLAGDWIGTAGGLTLEARIGVVGDNSLSVALSSFADSEQPAPGGVPLAQWHELAAGERAFVMRFDASRPDAIPHAFYGNASTEEGLLSRRVGGLVELRAMPSVALQMTITGGGAGGVEPVTVALRPADRPLRATPAHPASFEGMSGAWIGVYGPLVIEADLDVAPDGTATGQLHSFVDPAIAVFPAQTPRAFTWIHEIVSKRQAFAMSFEGSPPAGADFVAGRSESQRTQDFGFGTDARIQRTGPDTLSLFLAHPTNGSFDVQAMRLVRRTTPLRPVPSLDGAMQAPDSAMAGAWIWSLGADQTGNVILLDLTGSELGALSGAIQVWNTDGTCEAFLRTQMVCELGRDFGPFENRIALSPSGDDKWPYTGVEGLRAYGKDFPAYSDLRIRLRLAQNGALLVQMTADDAFGMNPDNTYVFERVDRNAAAAPIAPGTAERDYLAGPDDPARAACEAWARDDSLLRQKNNPAVTAELDAIFAAQKIGISGHPLDRQCKSMLDAMNEAGLDPTREDGGLVDGGDGSGPLSPGSATAAPVVGTWQMIGQTHFSVPNQNIWRRETPWVSVPSSLEIGAIEQRGYPVAGVDWLFTSNGSASVDSLSGFLANTLPGVGGGSLLEWIGTPENWLYARGIVEGNNGGELLFLVSGDRGLLLSHPENTYLASFLMMPGMGGPRNLMIAAYERTGSGGAPDPETKDPETSGPETSATDPEEAKKEGDVAGSDPVNIPVPPLPEANAVCQALDRREAELLAQAGPELVQTIRAIHADAGLAFGGAPSEAKCQRALDGLNAIVLAPATAAEDPVPPQTGGSTLVENTVLVFEDIISRGGDWSDPSLPDPCGALSTISASLSFQGGLGMSGFLSDLFVQFDLGGSLAGNPEQCFDALTVMKDYGLGLGQGDGGLDVALYIDRVSGGGDGGSVPAGAADSRACRAWDMFSAGLLSRADTPLVQFLRGYAIEQGFGMLSDREPTAAECARMLGELRDFGLDPDLPDGGWSIAVVALEGTDDVAAGEGAPSGDYDPRPESGVENAGWLEEAGYTHAVPVPDALQEFRDRANALVVFFTPADGLLGGPAARMGDPLGCASNRRLSRDEAMRAWAGMREIMRHLASPGGIISGRDCGLVETAAEASFATYGDPAFEFDGEMTAVVLDRRLDGVGLSAEDRGIAARTVSSLMADAAAAEGRSWQAVFTTPDIAEAVTGIRPETASALVWDMTSGEVVSRFRMRLSGEQE